MIFRKKSGPIFLLFCQGSRVWQTDRQTDKILIVRPHLHFMQPEASVSELRPSGAGGRLTPEGHEGWSTVWGLGGGDKTLNTRRIQLWNCCYCDMWQIQMHIQWCRHQMFINHWQSVTQTVHSIFFAVRWFPQTPCPASFADTSSIPEFPPILKVLESTWIFSPKFKALKVRENRSGAWKSLNSIPQVLESPWIHQVKLCDISNFAVQKSAISLQQGPADPKFQVEGVTPQTVFLLRKLG